MKVYISSSSLGYFTVGDVLYWEVGREMRRTVDKLWKLANIRLAVKTSTGCQHLGGEGVLHQSFDDFRASMQVLWLPTGWHAMKTCRLRRLSLPLLHIGGQGSTRMTTSPGCSTTIMRPGTDLQWIYNASSDALLAIWFASCVSIWYCLLKLQIESVDVLPSDLALRAAFLNPRRWCSPITGIVCLLPNSSQWPKPLHQCLNFGLHFSKLLLHTFNKIMACNYGAEILGYEQLKT